MTAPQHPQRCETCNISGCNERTNTSVDFISDIRRQNIIEDFISKHGCASHSSSPAAAPVPECRETYANCPYNPDTIEKRVEAAQQQAAAKEREKIHKMQRKRFPLAIKEIDSFFESLRRGGRAAGVREGMLRKRNDKWEIANVSEALSDTKTYEVRRNGRFFCTTASVKTANMIIDAVTGEYYA